MTGEFALLAGLRDLLDGDGPGVPLGVDDDAAVVEVGGAPVAVAVDTLVDGRHVDRAISSLDDLGWKALAVNLSDLAAIAAVPVAAVVSLQRPDGFDLEQTRALYAGLRACADRYGCRIVGGDTVGAPTLTVSVTVLGVLADEERGPVRRDGARLGDAVAVVGRLGLAAAGLALHRARATEVLADHPDLSAAHRRPEPLVAAAAPLALGGATAAIDVSDGLGRDLGHVAAASEVGIRLDARRLPQHPGVTAAAARLGVDPLDWVVAGGDDYAIAVTVPAERLARWETALETAGLRGVVIGEVVAGEGVDLDGRDVSSAGYEH